MDYCTLATARFSPVVQQIAKRFQELKIEHQIGQLKLKISGFINACGHHHIGHIGILEVERSGIACYQITFGGKANSTTTISEKTELGFSATGLVPAIVRLIAAYLKLSFNQIKTFIQTDRRVGIEPSKQPSIRINLLLLNQRQIIYESDILILFTRPTQAISYPFNFYKKSCRYNQLHPTSLRMQDSRI